jgi:hypothetical protein
MSSPEQVAETIYDGWRKGKRLVVLSAVGRLARILSRLSPALYERTMTRRFRIELEP